MRLALDLGPVPRILVDGGRLERRDERLLVRRYVQDVVLVELELVDDLVECGSDGREVRLGGDGRGKTERRQVGRELEDGIVELEGGSEVWRVDDVVACTM